MEQSNIVKKIRGALSQHFDLEENESAHLNERERGISNSRFIGKIPRRNYVDLPRLVPINWL